MTDVTSRNASADRRPVSMPTMNLPTSAGETAASAVAVQAQTEILAAYQMAQMRPRNFDDARSALLKECRRPSFARAAQFNIPKGGGIKGPSIRFAEAAMRCMTNFMVQTATIYDDREKRIVRVKVIDLEANTTQYKDITIDKVVETRFLRDGQVAISSRANSEGQMVHTVAASESDLLHKEGALVSKAMRTAAIRMIPGDLIEECMEIAERTQYDREAADPDASRKRMVDAFASVGIKASDLEGYLGHSLDMVSPEKVVEMRGLFTAIKDGEVKWGDLVSEKRGEAKKLEAPVSEEAENRAEDIRTAINDAQNLTELAAAARGVSSLPESLASELRKEYAVIEAEMRAAKAGPSNEDLFGGDEGGDS